MRAVGSDEETASLAQAHASCITFHSLEPLFLTIPIHRSAFSVQRLKAMPRLLTKQRQQAIVEMVARDGQATVDHLRQLFDVSHATIRRDLDDLHTQGLVLRTHGGAVRLNQAGIESPVR